jgi:regulator of replication initiation timing
LKIQVKELIEENTYLRSKDKSSKGELKHEAVELKKLINRFAESITEKDMQIEQLKMTNKELNKEMVALKESK